MAHQKAYLQIKILLSYLIVVVVIVCVISVFIYEHNQIQKVKTESAILWDIHGNVNNIHRNIVDLALQGEVALGWDEDMSIKYNEQLSHTDSMLVTLKNRNVGFITDESIDTIQILLKDKEALLNSIMHMQKDYNETQNQLYNEMPKVIKQASQVKIIKTKKKGIAGWLGGKNSVLIRPKPDKLNKLREEMVALHRQQIRDAEIRMDSLSIKNEQLNRKLAMMLNSLDCSSEDYFVQYSNELDNIRIESLHILSSIAVILLVLLFISFLIIHRDIKRSLKSKRDKELLIEKLNSTGQKNEDLIISRKKAMHTITHELRTPLTAIHGYAELIQGSGTVETQRHAESILQASNRMIAMLNSLLDFFRLDSGKEKPDCKLFRLQSVADTLDAEFRPMAENKDLKLTVENSADVILMGDRERIIQIGDNLLSNAIKYTQAGSVSLKTDYDNGTLSITVEDTGSGMSEEEQQRVFSAFERLSNAATQDGFGLGLSIVKHVVDMLDGTIRLESEKGRGSRFTVEIPIQTSDAVDEEGGSKARTPNAEKSYSVLVLDDNDIVRSMMKDMYAGVGVHCDTSGSIGDVMEAIRSRHYDLLITDMKMPEINGYEVLELLRSSDVGNSKEIPVIVATASGSCTEEELLAHGFTACLFKPFDITELLEVSEKYAIRINGADYRPDFTSLLAYGDKAAMLERLTTETKKDMQAVREAESINDRKALDGQVHRLRSSWAVIRADKPLWELYNVLHGERAYTTEELRYAVDGVLRMGTLIIELAKEEERRLADESACD